MTKYYLILLVFILAGCTTTPEQRATHQENKQIAYEKYARVVASCDTSRGGQMVYERGSSTVSPHTRLTLAQMKSASCVYPWSARTGDFK